MVRFTEISSGFIILIVPLSVATFVAYECENDPIPLGRSTFDKKFKKWSGNEFVYKFDENLPNDFKTAFISATEQIANVSCLKFMSFEDAISPSRFLFVYEKLVPKKPDCGFAGVVIMSYDEMKLVSSCERDHSQHPTFIALIVHELFHALGFHHTQKRSDRDQYVTFHNESLENQTKASQFKICSDEDCDYHNMPYDCKSIMHYEAWTFGDKSKECSESDPSGCPLRGKTEECNKALHESHDKMTETDIKHLNLLYPCSTTTTTTTSADSCNGKCTGKSPDNSCWCDQHCETYKDCCLDRYEYTC